MVALPKRAFFNALPMADEPNEADQKWLAAVTKMVAEGKTEISTHSETRVVLLKEWAGKNGYTVNVKRPSPVPGLNWPRKLPKTERSARYCQTRTTLRRADR